MTSRRVLRMAAQLAFGAWALAALALCATVLAGFAR